MPIDRGVVDQQLLALGEGPAWWEKRELRDLPTVLHADEVMCAIARGKVARGRWIRRTWLIVVTDRRLVCLRSAGRAGWRQLEVAADQMTRVALRIGPFHARVVVVARGRTQRLLVSRADGYRLSAALKALCSPADATRSALRPTRVIRRVFDHVLALPAAAFSPDTPAGSRPALPADPAASEKIHALEEEVEELRQQVRFLEQLLHERQARPPQNSLRSD